MNEESTVTSRGLVGTISGLLFAMVATGPSRGQPAQEIASPPDNAAARSARELAEQLRRYPARPTSAPDQMGVFLIDAAGGLATLIANEPDPWLTLCRSAVWSSDGKTILFAASTSEQGEPVARPISRLKTLQVSDGRLTLGDLGPGGDADFSPRGDRILFFDANFGRPMQGGLWLMDADGSHREFLTGQKRPRWSPDVNHFMIMLMDVPTRLSIVDVAPEKSGSVQLADARILSPPSWAGATTLVAVIGRAAAESIALVDVSQPGKSQVAEILWKRGDGLDLDPSFPIYAPKTGRCVFVGTQNGKGAALYTVERGKPRSLARLENGDLDARIVDLAFSPDGQYVLFSSDRKLGRQAPGVRAQSADAPALSGITIDGDLRDWPPAIPRHAIENMHQFPFTNGPGPREHAFLSTSADLSAAFSVGYDPGEQVIYIAVIVRDDTLIVGHSSPWDTDAVEIHVDGLHSATVQEVPRGANYAQTLDASETVALEYIGIPGRGRVFGIEVSSGIERGEDNPILQFGDIKKTKTRMAFRRVGDVTTYEWAVQAFDHYPDKPTMLVAGARIGLDVVVLDKDKRAQTPRAFNDPDPDRQAWVSWGPAWRRLKCFDAANLGEIVLGRAPRP